MSCHLLCDTSTVDELFYKTDGKSSNNYSPCSHEYYTLKRTRLPNPTIGERTDTDSEAGIHLRAAGSMQAWYAATRPTYGAERSCCLQQSCVAQIENFKKRRGSCVFTETTSSTQPTSHVVTSFVKRMCSNGRLAHPQPQAWTTQNVLLTFQWDYSTSLSILFKLHSTILQLQ